MNNFKKYSTAVLLISSILTAASVHGLDEGSPDGATGPVYEVDEKALHAWKDVYNRLKKAGALVDGAKLREAASMLTPIENKYGEPYHSMLKYDIRDFESAGNAYAGEGAYGHVGMLCLNYYAYDRAVHYYELAVKSPYSKRYHDTAGLIAAYLKSNRFEEAVAAFQYYIDRSYDFHLDETIHYRQLIRELSRDLNGAIPDFKDSEPKLLAWLNDSLTILELFKGEMTEADLRFQGKKLLRGIEESYGKPFAELSPEELTKVNASTQGRRLKREVMNVRYPESVLYLDTPDQFSRFVDELMYMDPEAAVRRSEIAAALNQEAREDTDEKKAVEKLKKYVELIEKSEDPNVQYVAFPDDAKAQEFNAIDCRLACRAFETLEELTFLLPYAKDDASRYQLYAHIIAALGSFTFWDNFFETKIIGSNLSDAPGQAAWANKALNDFKDQPQYRIKLHQSKVFRLKEGRSKQTPDQSQPAADDTKELRVAYEQFCAEYPAQCPGGELVALKRSQGEDVPLAPSNFSFMLGGNFFSGSPIGAGIGGYAQSGNLPKAADASIGDLKNEVYLLAFPDEEQPFSGGYKGMRVVLVNVTDKQQAFNASNSRLYIIQEAKDENGEWKPIEYLPSSWCGNSYHSVVLQPKQYWEFTAPRYAGKMPTTVRFALTGTGPIYSNEFEGSINPQQFSEKRQHQAGDVMDP